MIRRYTTEQKLIRKLASLDANLWHVSSQEFADKDGYEIEFEGFLAGIYKMRFDGNYVLEVYDKKTNLEDPFLEIDGDEVLCQLYEKIENGILDDSDTRINEKSRRRLNKVLSASK